MKNIVSRWIFCYLYLITQGFSVISLISLLARNASKAEIAKHLVIPLMKGNSYRFNIIQYIQVSPETYKQNSAPTHRFFQLHAGGIPFHNADLNNYIKSKMKYDFY